LTPNSAATIAKALGISRNAMLGKAWREGWPHGSAANGANAHRMNAFREQPAAE
jgi:hypothetical protein